MTREWEIHIVHRHTKTTYQTWGVEPLPKVGGTLILRELVRKDGAMEDEEVDIQVSVIQAKEVIVAAGTSMTTPNGVKTQARRFWEVIVLPTAMLDDKNREPPAERRKAGGKR